MDANTKHCKHIAETLEAVAEGRAFYDEDRYMDFADDFGEIPEDAEQASFFDYFEGGLYDIEYRIGSDREYRSARAMVACGGPNIYIDTKTGTVDLHWWANSASYPIAEDACRELDEFFEELYMC